MPAQGFFETFAPDDVAKTVSAMALKKMDLDQANRQVKMAEEKWNLEKTALKDKLDRQKLFRQSLIDQITQKSNVLGQINPEHPELKALDVIKTGLITGGLDTDKAVAGLVDLEQKNLPTPKLVNYINPKDPTQGRVVVEGRELPPAGYVTEATFRAMKSGTQPTVPSLVATTQDPNATQDDKDRADRILKGIKDQNTQDPSWQSSSVTEKGGLPIWKNPKTKETVVRKPDGTEESYDPTKHGRELGQSLSQSSFETNKQGAALKPGTMDYWASIYETTGQMPSFGMGNKGAAQRQAFLDTVASRAIARGEGANGVAQAVRVADFKTSQTALSEVTKREQMIQSYNARIIKTTDGVLIPLIKKWDLQNPRFANIPVNELSRIMGSGDLAALKLALNSVSVEVGKVEFNALGIQQLSETATKFMKDIHDENMSVKELLKVLKTSKELGETGKDAITQQREDLKQRMSKIVAPNLAGVGSSAPGRIKVNPADVKIIKR